MLAELAPLFAATVQHAPATGFNKFGEAGFGPATSYPARVIHRARRIRVPSGELAVSRGEVWIAGTPLIGLNDAITLPDGTTPPILSAEMLTDENGPSHAHVYFG